VAAPLCGFVASNRTLRDAMAWSWVAFSSTFPATHGGAMYEWVRSRTRARTHAGAELLQESRHTGCHQRWAAALRNSYKGHQDRIVRLLCRVTA
jgi:hypothetical protein